MSDIELPHSALTGKIINSFYRVYDELGYGFLERVYCGALEVEFRRHLLGYHREAPIDVLYHGAKVGLYRADFLIEGKVIVEVKASRALSDADRKQVLNNLRATQIELGIQLHFGPKPVFKRMLLENHRKRGVEIIA